MLPRSYGLHVLFSENFHLNRKRSKCHLIWWKFIRIWKLFRGITIIKMSSIFHNNNTYTPVCLFSWFCIVSSSRSFLPSRRYDRIIFGSIFTVVHDEVNESHINGKTNIFLSTHTCCCFATSSCENSYFWKNANRNAVRAVFCCSTRRYWGRWIARTK